MHNLRINCYVRIIKPGLKETGYVGKLGSIYRDHYHRSFGVDWASEYRFDELERITPAEYHASPEHLKLSKGWLDRLSDREAAAYQPKIVLDAITNALPPKPVYKIVQTVEGRMVATRPTSIHAWAHANGRAVYNVARVAHLRPELQCQPHVQGLLGPMWDGLNQDGALVIRYEDDQTYNTLSH